MTGLAQLVAEELECDWSKVTTEYPTPGENAARKRVWGNFSTGGSRGIRESNEYVREGGAAARDMLIRAAAAEWGVPPGRMQRRQQRHHAHAVRPDDDLRQGRRGGRQARAAAGGQAQGPEGLEDRRQAGQAARHRRQGDRRAGLRHRPQTAGHADRDDPRLPGHRRQGQELQRRQGAEHARRQEGRAGRRYGVAVIADNFWNAKTALAALPDRMGRGAERRGQQRRYRRDAEGRARRRAGLRRQQGGRRQGGDRRRRESGRGGLQLSRTSTTRRWSR